MSDRLVHVGEVVEEAHVVAEVFRAGVGALPVMMALMNSRYADPPATRICVVSWCSRPSARASVATLVKGRFVDVC